MKKHFVRMLLFFFGLWFSAMGVICFLKGSSLGLDPWDVFYYGLSRKINLSLGTCVQIISFLCLLSTVLHTKKFPKIGTWLTLILYGRIIDLLSKLALIPPSPNHYFDILYLGFGTIAVGVGSGMYISAKWGAGPIDGFTLMISEVTKIKLARTYMLLAIIVSIAGYVLGGPVSICTVFYTVAVGPMIQISYKYCKRIEFVLRRNRARRIMFY
jgi:uncharacterized protein